MDWHKRFLQQAVWTRDLRTYLFEQAGLSHARSVLEVGCGTGAILADLSTPAAVYAVDLNPACLNELRLHAPAAAPVYGDAQALPYTAGIFDITFCHYLLLWLQNPLQVLVEMKRVTCPGGAILALAEPDYEARVDKPEALAPLGRWQAEALRRRGAEPGLGNRLAGLFDQAGIRIIETGILQSGGSFMQSPAERDLEWSVLEADLAEWVPAREIYRLKLLDEEAWMLGSRVLDVPTHFAWGRV